MSPHSFTLVLGRGVQRRLQAAVEAHGTAVALPGRRQHLDLPTPRPCFWADGRRTAPPPCTPHAPEPAAQEEEVPLVAGQGGGWPKLTAWALRMMADSYAWRNTSLRNTGSPSAAHHVAEHVPRAHGGQLIGVAHHHQPALGRRACSSASISSKSTMLISSTMTASACSGSFAIW